MAHKMDVANIAAVAVACQPNHSVETESQSRAEAELDRTPSAVQSDPRKIWSLAHVFRFLALPKRNETAL
jgi:hypothetical protein